MSNNPKAVIPYGIWPSAVTPEMAAGKSLRLGMLAGEGGAIYWSEGRPAEGGRVAVMQARPGEGIREILPAPFSARSKVHEYGGGEFLVAGERLFFVEAESQDIHVLPLDGGGAPRRLTQLPGMRFADMTLDVGRGRLIAVAERQPAGGKGESHAYPENLLVAVPIDAQPGEPVSILAQGHDFYASPRVSPDGERLAYLAWDLPAMPWEAAALHIGRLEREGALHDAAQIAGGAGAPVFQPEWSGDSALLFVWDERGWGNLYRWRGGEVEALTDFAEELLRPQWVFGMRSHARLADGSIAAVFLREGGPVLRLIGPEGQRAQARETPLREISSIAPFGEEIAVMGTGDREPPAVLRLGRDGAVRETLRGALDARLEPCDISAGRVLRVAGRRADGIFALYYPPANCSCEGPPDALPPLVVMVHGGPTGQADRGFKVKTQYWTSRGFAVCDVDYSGSSGYGRAYRERLRGCWGIRDVEDVEDVVRHLWGEKLADRERTVISGGSAGGYTVLMALAHTDIFAAGACSYAVCDLAQLQRITHKFEAGYLYGLVGATPQTSAAIFAERSPLNLADRITAPVIFFQGSDDKVVPPQQSRAMAETLRRNGVDASYHEFAGEGHGFRQGATIERVFRLEHDFFRRQLRL
ncbi:MAG: S9 family peptidase [Alphaproteobacteria bacterium]|nr:MAG: S9 family peptidase [Alphaproteobacteria bacterium]